ncbi:unnamed protein product [Cochlearia groenlandica]
MSDSDMDIDDDEVQVKVEHKIAGGGGEAEVLGGPIKALDSHNDLKKQSYEQSSIIIKDSSQPNVSMNIGKQTMLEDQKATVFTRFPAPCVLAQSFIPGNEPEQKRQAVACKFFAKGWCAKGNVCKFLHVNENLNHTSQQQTANHMAGSSGMQPVQERRTLEMKEGLRVPLLHENGVTSLHYRGDISLVNPPGGQRVFPFKNEMRFMSSSENMARESLQNCSTGVPENKSMFINNSNPFALRSSFVHEHSSSGPAWTGSLFSSAPSKGYVSNLEDLGNTNNICESGSLPTPQGTSVSSDQDAEGNITSNNKKVSSNDWDPSEPFKASFTIPPYILPSSDALYDPFTDIEKPEDISLTSPLSSKGKEPRKNSRKRKDDDSSSGPQPRDCNNDDKNSSCSQNQYQETTARKNLEAHGVLEGVDTSVVDQNDAATPSKEASSAAAATADNRAAIKRSKPAGHESWHKSDGSSYQKTLKSDDVGEEVRSSAATKVMRQFRTAVVETIKEMLKPLWREGRLSKEVHNMIVKKASEKIVSTAVQLHHVPTETGSVDQYLSLYAPKMVKLVEGYVEKFGKP